MSETAYRRCPAGCMDGDIPVYGLNGVQTGQEVCQTCCGTGYVEVPGAVVLDAATAAAAKEACERLTEYRAARAETDTVIDDGTTDAGERFDAVMTRYMAAIGALQALDVDAIRAAAAALRGEGTAVTTEPIYQVELTETELFLICYALAVKPTGSDSHALWKRLVMTRPVGATTEGQR